MTWFCLRHGTRDPRLLAHLADPLSKCIGGSLIRWTANLSLRLAISYPQAVILQYDAISQWGALHSSFFASATNSDRRGALPESRSPAQTHPTTHPLLSSYRLPFFMGCRYLDSSCMGHRPGLSASLFHQLQIAHTALGTQRATYLQLTTNPFSPHPRVREHRSCHCQV